MRVVLAVLLVCAASPMASAQTPTLPICTDNGADHQRWALKTQPGPATMTAGDGQDIDVAEMVTWRVPGNIPANQRTSDKPITQREKDHKLDPSRAPREGQSIGRRQNGSSPS